LLRWKIDALPDPTHLAENRISVGPGMRPDISATVRRPRATDRAVVIRNAAAMVGHRHAVTERDPTVVTTGIQTIDFLRGLLATDAVSAQREQVVRLSENPRSR